MKVTEAIQLLESYKVFEAAFRNGGQVDYAAKKRNEKTGEERSVTESHTFNFKEFIGTKDAVWMFPKVVSSVMMEAAEPEFLVTPLLSKVRVSESTKIVEYNAVGALRAYEVPEGQEYPTDDLAWSSGTATAKITKKGLRIPISEEMLADAAYDIVSLYMRAAGRAMARLKEQICLDRFNQAGTVLLNNSDNAAWNGKRFSGVDAAGNPNGSIDAQDWLNVFGQMLASGFTPSHIVMHPLAWSMFAQDPIVQSFAWYNNGLGLRAQNQLNAAGQVTSNPSMAAFLQRTAPMGLQVICSPFVKYDATLNVTDIIVLDANELGAITIRDDMSTEQFLEPARDLISMKVKERYDVTLFPTNGMNVCRLSNVKVARNYGRSVEFTNDLGGQDFAAYGGITIA